MPTSSPQPLWTPTPDAIDRARMTQFARRVAADPETGFAGADYRALHRWSVAAPGAFWRKVWQFCGVRGDPGAIDCAAAPEFWNWRFFPEGRLNFAENLLKPERMGDPAFAAAPTLVAYDETGPCGARSRRELLDEVGRLAAFLRARNVAAGARIAAVLPNRIEAVVGMLAAAAVGAIWSSASPDFGDDALLDRFGQIEPSVLISAEATRYNGKTIPLTERVARLAGRLPSLRHWIVVGAPPAVGGSPVATTSWDEIRSSGAPPPAFEALPFQHPLAILYSSGTTGTPKCIVHGAGGTLLQHLKEHQFHCGLRPGDRLFYYTTTGWMMWNWLVSGLASEATIVLYDGSPLAPDAGALWRMAERTGATHFGASARYYAALEQARFSPREQVELGELRCLLSTGSPLLPGQFEWLYRAVKPDLHVASISGGTDIVSCFALGNPAAPVHAGELQCKGLGMDVRIFDEHGRPTVGTQGELVCATPFPSMPIGFWNDPDQAKYQSTYFDRFPNVWRHGDWALETETGGVVIFGRSDAVLNPGGVRIGTAEIYQQLQRFPEVAEGLAAALRRGGDEQIVLFLKLTAGQALDDRLVAALRAALRQRCSPRHVPQHVVEAPDLPRTISGKLSEIAVRNALDGREVGNAGALANPECLEFFRRWSRELGGGKPLE